MPGVERFAGRADRLHATTSRWGHLPWRLDCLVCDVPGADRHAAEALDRCADGAVARPRTRARFATRRGRVAINADVADRVGTSRRTPTVRCQVRLFVTDGQGRTCRAPHVQVYRAVPAEGGAAAPSPTCCAWTHGGPAHLPRSAVAPARYPGLPRRAKSAKTPAPTSSTPSPPPTTTPGSASSASAGSTSSTTATPPICSISGDVWVVSGIDDKLENLKWRRYATGLFQPLGLKIVDDVVYVLGRDQITRLHDLNGDGEADFYENFNNDCKVTPGNGHAYATCLETDPEGNFYYCKCGDGTAHGGTVLKVDKYGDKLEVFATGVRNSNGLGGGPRGPHHRSRQRGRMGPGLAHRRREAGHVPRLQADGPPTPPPTDPGKPIVWMPQNVDNSSGGQIWVDRRQVGPAQGRDAPHQLRRGRAAARHDRRGGRHRRRAASTASPSASPPASCAAASARRTASSTSAACAAGRRPAPRTAPSSASATPASRSTCPPPLHVHANGIRFSFTCPLDPKTAADAGSYSVLQWNYNWSASYGSPHLVRAKPREAGLRHA